MNSLLGALKDHCNCCTIAIAVIICNVFERFAILLVLIAVMLCDTFALCVVFIARCF